MKLEEVIPALRWGRKIRRAGWSANDYLQATKDGLLVDAKLEPIRSIALLVSDWEIVPRRMAEYWVPDTPNGDTAKRKLLEIGCIPAGAALIPGTEFEEKEP